MSPASSLFALNWDPISLMWFSLVPEGPEAGQGSSRALPHRWGTIGARDIPVPWGHPSPLGTTSRPLLALPVSRVPPHSPRRSPSVCVVPAEPPSAGGSIPFRWKLAPFPRRCSPSSCPGCAKLRRERGEGARGGSCSPNCDGKGERSCSRSVSGAVPLFQPLGRALGVGGARRGWGVPGSPGSTAAGAPLPAPDASTELMNIYGTNIWGPGEGAGGSRKRCQLWSTTQNPQPDPKSTVGA